MADTTELDLTGGVPISELVPAVKINPADKFVLEQDGVPKQLTGEMLIDYVSSLMNGHGSITDIVKKGTDGLVDTYQITMEDKTYYTFNVTNGERGLSLYRVNADMAHIDVTHPFSDLDIPVLFTPMKHDLVLYNNGDLARIASVDKTAQTVQVHGVGINLKGNKGDDGDTPQLCIKYASQKPTVESPSMGDVPDNWIGIYSGPEVSYTLSWWEYKWFKIKGEPGESIKGDPGVTPALRIGTVTSVAFDQPASATISGPAENPVLSLMIPKGEPGANGENSADWLVNRTDDPGYVRNRTHYSIKGETPFVGISVTLNAFGESNFTTDLLTDNLGYNIMYRVKFDGNDYYCRSKDLFGDKNTHTVAIGNCRLEDSYCDDTGEPFLIELFTADPGSGWIRCPGYENQSINVVVYAAEEVQKLDNKYLNAAWIAEKTYKGVDGMLVNNGKIHFTGSSAIHSGFPNYWLDAGGKYDVYWNRQLYECVCFVRDNTLHLGNGSLAGTTGGEDVPFCFVSFGGPGAFVYKNTETAEDVPLTIIGHRETLINKLPEEFIPDSVYQRLANLEARIAALTGE